MTLMRFYLPTFLTYQRYSPLRRPAKGCIELTSLSEYMLRDIGMDQLKRSRRVHTNVQ
jgi:hypothetical protein